MKIVKENLRGCINKEGAPDCRYYVIKAPINETGICVEFESEKEAQEYIQANQIAERNIMKLGKYSALCENWGIDPEANRETFEWLKDDPRDEQGRLTREVGIRKPGGPVERLERRHTKVGVLFYSLADGTLFPRGTGAQVSAMDFDFDR
jgi:hypothetical protein